MSGLYYYIGLTIFAGIMTAFVFWANWPMLKEDKKSKKTNK